MQSPQDCAIEQYCRILAQPPSQCNCCKGVSAALNMLHHRVEEVKLQCNPSRVMVEHAFIGKFANKGVSAS